MSADQDRASKERAVVDRIVDGRSAVLLVGNSEAERVVPLERLPQGAREGSWLRVRFRGDELTEAAIDETAADQIEERIARKLDSLRRRGRRPSREP